MKNNKDDMYLAKFINFALWISAVVNLFNAYISISGNRYGNITADVYAAYPSLMLVEVLYGVLCILTSTLEIYTAISLIKCKKQAIKLVPSVYIITTIIVLLYVALSSIVVGASGFDTRIITIVLVNIIMTVVSLRYFKDNQQKFMS